MLMIRPHRAFRMCGKAARHIYKTVSKFDVKMLCQSSSDDSASVPQRKSPTLLTMTSRRPKRSATVLINWSHRPASVMSVSTATQSTPLACNCRRVCCAATLLERYAMAIRAPSCASRTASPRPMPLLPPVTSATRLRSDILIPGKIAWKDFQYSLAAAAVLPKPRHDHRHVIRLFRSPGPFLGCSHQRLSNHERRSALHVDGCFLQTSNPKFFAINVLRLDQAVTVSDQERVGAHDQQSFLINVIFHHAENHAAYVQFLGTAFADQKCRQVACVCIPQSSCPAVISSDEECRESVVASVAHQMLVQAGHQLRHAQALAAFRKHLAAQCRLQTGHQQCSRNSLP